MSTTESPESGVKRTEIVSKWCEQHNVIEELIPFSYLSYDPIDCLIEIQNGLENIPDYGKSVSARKIERDTELEMSGHTPDIVPLFEMVGSWKSPEAGSKGGVEFVNPSYKHIGHHSVTREQAVGARINVIRRVAQYGVVTQKQLAPRFGLSHGGLRNFISEHNVEWRLLYESGLTRIARTWALLREWGKDDSTIAEAFGYSRENIRQRIHKDVPDGFTAPVDFTVGQSSGALRNASNQA